MNRIKIHYLFRESVSPSHYQFKTIFLNSLFIHFLYHSSDFSQIRYLLHEVTMNSLSFSQIYYDFTLLRAFIMNWLTFSRFIYCFSKALWMHYLFLEFTMAELRLDSEIIGNFRNFEKFFDHFVERQKWPLQTNFECVGVFQSRDIAICNLETWVWGNYP